MIIITYICEHLKKKEMSQKEERSEYLGIYVTPSIKNEFELAKDNKYLQEVIIKNYLTSEKDWLESELKQIDESTIKYSAKLLGIKDSFQKCQNEYVEQIECIYKNADSTFRKLDTICNSINKNIENTKSNLDSLLKRVSEIDFYRIEKTLEIINKVNSMSPKELELLKKLLN